MVSSATELADMLHREVDDLKMMNLWEPISLESRRPSERDRLTGREPIQ
jgi:hypothetical protein